MPPRRLPEIDIPFLEGEEPWQVIDATRQRQLDRAAINERQLISWCSLPLATMLINEYIVDQKVMEGMRHGFHMVQNDYLERKLDEEIAQTQQKMQSGSARPPFIHIANDPEYEDRLTVLVPKANRKYQHDFFDLVGEFKILSRRGAQNIANPPQTVRVKRYFSKSKNLMATKTKLHIPGNEPYTQAPVEKPSELPVSKKTSAVTVANHEDWRADPNQ